MDSRWIRLLIAFAVFFLLPLVSQPAQAKSGSLDKAYLQSIWDGWASGNVDGQSKYYAQGTGHTFFDIAPLKYNNWDEYKLGVQPVLKQFTSMKFVVNDDLQIHTAGNSTSWVDSTVNLDATTSQGQPVKMTLRWTAILDKQADRWLITHEHVSVPMQEAK